MADPSAFTDFIARIRAGDDLAATELVRQYEPLVRREVRLRLEDSRLGRAFDAEDICQSVMASFFVRAAAGQYDLAEVSQLPKLLVRMTRNKLASAARHQTRQRRDHRRVDRGDDLNEVANDAPTASRLVAGRELLERFQSLLSPDERQIADLRGQGMAWSDVAGHLGGTAQARRVQLARAVERASRSLGLDDLPTTEGD